MNATRMQAFLKFLSLFAKAGITVLFCALEGWFYGVLCSHQRHMTKSPMSLSYLY